MLPAGLYDPTTPKGPLMLLFFTMRFTTMMGKPMSEMAAYFRADGHVVDARLEVVTCVLVHLA